MQNESRVYVPTFPANIRKLLKTSVCGMPSKTLDKRFRVGA